MSLKELFHGALTVAWIFILFILNAGYFDTLNPTGFRDAFYAKEDFHFLNVPDLEHTLYTTNLDAHLSASGILHAFL